LIIFSSHRCTLGENPGVGVPDVYAKIPMGVRKNCFEICLKGVLYLHSPLSLPHPPVYIYVSSACEIMYFFRKITTFPNKLCYRKGFWAHFSRFQMFSRVDKQGRALHLEKVK
jgi:hypothetical protein